MQVTINIPDELAAEAQKRGLVLETYLRDLMAEDFAQPPSAGNHGREAVQDMLRFAQQHGAMLHGADLKAMAHEGHKY